MTAVLELAPHRDARAAGLVGFTPLLAWMPDFSSTMGSRLQRLREEGLDPRPAGAVRRDTWGDRRGTSSDRRLVGRGRRRAAPPRDDVGNAHRRQREDARELARIAGADEVHDGLLPANKAGAVQRLAARPPVAMAGDGINDASALATQTSASSWEPWGTDVAIETSDVAVMGRRPPTSAGDLPPCPPSCEDYAPEPVPGPLAAGWRSTSSLRWWSSPMASERDGARPSPVMRPISPTSSRRPSPLPFRVRRRLLWNSRGSVDGAPAGDVSAAGSFVTPRAVQRPWVRPDATTPSGGVEAEGL